MGNELRLTVGCAGWREIKTRETSCMVGLSEELCFVQRRASWNVFLTWAKSMQVTETSGSTASITVLLSILDNIWQFVEMKRINSDSSKKMEVIYVRSDLI